MKPSVQAHDTLPGGMRSATGGGQSAGHSACVRGLASRLRAGVYAGLIAILAHPGFAAAYEVAAMRCAESELLAFNARESLGLNGLASSRGVEEAPPETAREARDPVQTAKWFGVCAALMLLMRNAHRR